MIAPLNNSAPSSINYNRPSLTPITAPLRTPFTTAAPPIPATSAHHTPSPHLLPSSLTLTSSSLGAKVPPPVCRVIDTASHSSRCHPCGKPPWPRAASRPSSGEPPLRPCLRCRPWSTSGGPCPCHFPLENKYKTRKSLLELQRDPCPCP
jgi:hypothetical protein